jgi:methyl-accepting chemotaxis protein
MPRNTKLMDLSGQIEAIHKVMAVIEFELDGTIITANENFLSAVGYTLEEVQGKHHRLFVDLAYGQSEEYQAFWAALAAGEFRSGEFKRYSKDGRPVWIQASYNPILNERDEPYKVVKFATDVTAQKQERADFEGQIEAIHKAMAVIEFELDGTIITANENFLTTVGYTLEELRGGHHRLFVDPEYARDERYEAFWASLAAGEYVADEFLRYGKGGREIWIQASYNPILDPDGRPFKVVKYAMDVTEQKEQAARFFAELDAMMKRHSEKIESFAGTLSGNIDGVQSATGTLQVAVTEQALASEEQSRSITEITSALSELRQTANQTHEQADTVVETAQRSVASLEEGQGVMRECVTSLGEIRTGVGQIQDRIQALADHTQQIGDIIATVNEIAEQSKLLAFNASIEATRAGEFGKSFAIVAQEMRDLAGQSKQATREVRKLLSDIQKATEDAVQVTSRGYQQAESGFKLVHRVGEVMDGLGVVVKRSSDAGHRIAQAVQQQRLGVEQVSETMVSIDAAISQSAAQMSNVDEITRRLATTAESLGGLVEELRAMKEESGDAGDAERAVA